MRREVTGCRGGGRREYHGGKGDVGVPCWEGGDCNILEGAEEPRRERGASELWRGRGLEEQGGREGRLEDTGGEEGWGPENSGGREARGRRIMWGGRGLEDHGVGGGGEVTGL